MLLNINQAEYTKEMGDTAGMVMLILTQNQMPFPEDDGIILSPGHSTSISLSQVRLFRLGFTKIYYWWLSTII